MNESDAVYLIRLIHGLSASVCFHPERERRKHFSLKAAIDGHGGVNDMEEVGCGKDWEHAFADMWNRSRHDH